MITDITIVNSSEKFCLKWNDFSENLLSTFSYLRTVKYLQDVTLACEDGTQIVSHKVVLMAGSILVRNILGIREKKML